MNRGQKIHLPFIALMMGSLHGFHWDPKLGNVFGVEYCWLSPCSRGTHRVPSRCGPHEDHRNSGSHVRCRPCTCRQIVVIVGEVVLIRVFLERRDTGRYLISIRARQSSTFAFVFQHRPCVKGPAT